MKPQRRRASLWVFVFLSTIGAPLHAADVVKVNNTDALNLGTSWTGGTVPGSGDVAVWDSTVTTANATNLGADLSWQGIRIADPGGAVTINNTANILTLGSAGIDMSTATVNLTIGTSLVSGADQTWNLNASRTLNLWTVNMSRAATSSSRSRKCPTALPIRSPSVKSR
jgi:hypothetical protein